MGCEEDDVPRLYWRGNLDRAQHLNLISTETYAQDAHTFMDS